GAAAGAWAGRRIGEGFVPDVAIPEVAVSNDLLRASAGMPGRRKTIASSMLNDSRAGDVPKNLMLPDNTPEFIVAKLSPEQWAKGPVEVGQRIEYHGYQYIVVDIQEPESRWSSFWTNVGIVVGPWSDDGERLLNTRLHERRATTDVTLKLSYE